MSLLPPLSPLPHPQSLLRSYPTLSAPALSRLQPPVPPSPHPPVGPWPYHAKKTKKQKPPLPQARGPEESSAPLVSTEKPPSSLSCARPCPGTPAPQPTTPPPTQPPCRRPLVCQSQKGGPLKTMTHTGEVPRQLPVAPHGHQQGFKLLGLKHVFFFFFLLLLYVDVAFI